MKGLNKAPGRQRGASFFAIVLVMVLLGMFILAGLKLAPAYMDHNVIKNAISNLQESGDIEGMDLRDIRTYVDRTMSTNGSPGWDESAIDLVTEGNTEYITVNYEARVPLFYNIDAVVVFEDRIAR